MINNQLNKWQLVKLGEYCGFKGGKQPPKNTFEHAKKEGYVRLLQIRDFGEREDPVFVNSNNSLTYVKEDDVLIARYGASVGKVLTGEAGAINVAIIKTLPNDLLNNRYLYWLLNSSSFQDYIKDIPGRMAQAGFDKTVLEDFHIPLPFLNNKVNINEQKRIVDKIEKVKNYMELFDKQEAKIDNLLFSVCSTYFEIKEDNVLTKLGEICNIIKGSFPILKTLEGEYPLVVTAEDRKSANNYQIDDEAVCIPLVSSTGHGHASLKRIHYQEGKFALANIMVALVSKNKKKVLPKFLYYYLSFYKDSLLVSLMRGGANVTIPLKEIGNIEVRLPNVDKQQKFVTIVNKIEQQKTELLKRKILSEQLLNSTLNYAFEGKL